MKILKITLIYILYLFCVISAQDSDYLNNSIKKVIESDPRINSAKSDIIVSKARIKEARSALFPQLSASFGYTHSYQEYSEYTITSRTSDSYNIQGNLNQLLFDGLKTWNEITIAELYCSQSELEYINTENTVVYETLKYYYEVIKSMRLLVLQEYLLESANQQKLQADANMTAGLATQNDVLSAEVAVNDVNISKLKARTNYNRALIEWNNLIGNSLDSNMNSEMKDIKINYDAVELKSMINYALENRYEIKKSRIAVKISDLTLSEAFGNLYPKITLNGSWGFRDDVFLPKSQNWSLGVNFNIPLCTGGNNLGKIEEGTANKNKSIYQDENTKKQIILEIKNLHLSYQESMERYELSKKSIEKAKLNKEILEAKYRIGKAIFNEVTDAHASLSKAWSENIQAEYDVILNYLSLKKASGTYLLNLLEGYKEKE